MGTLSARLERFDVTAPLMFVLAGVLLTHGPLAPLGFAPCHEPVKSLAELTLVLVLALLVGGALAPTDAALGAGMMVNPAVPVRIRRLINVESGLNDGMARPLIRWPAGTSDGSLRQKAAPRMRGYRRCPSAGLSAARLDQPCLGVQIGRLG